MRIILRSILAIILVITFSYTANAQEPAIPLGSKNGAVKVLGKLYVDSILYLPQRKPSYIPKRNGAIVIDTILGGTWIYIKDTWVQLATMLDITPGGAITQDKYNEEFTGSTSSVLTLIDTPLLNTTRVYKNGIRLLPPNFSVTDNSITLSIPRLSGDLFIIDYTYGVSGGTPYIGKYNEEFTGSTSSTISLSHTPLSNTTRVYKNGIRLALVEFSLVDNIITLSSPRLAGDLFLIDYKY